MQSGEEKRLVNASEQVAKLQKVAKEFGSRKTNIVINRKGNSIDDYLGQNDGSPGVSNFKKGNHSTSNSNQENGMRQDGSNGGVASKVLERGENLINKLAKRTEGLDRESDQLTKLAEKVKKKAQKDNKIMNIALGVGVPLLSGAILAISWGKYITTHQQNFLILSSVLTAVAFISAVAGICFLLRSPSTYLDDGKTQEKDSTEKSK